MNQDKFTQDLADAVLERLRNDSYASIASQKANPDQNIRTITLALDTASDGISKAPVKIGFPFQSVYVADATDANVAVYLANKEIGNYLFDTQKLTLKDVVQEETTQAGGFIYFAAQAGKTITLTFRVYGQFRSGSQVSSTAGGVSITTGSTVTTNASEAVATTAAALTTVPTDSTRKLAVIRNVGPGVIFIGGATVTTDSGANPGIKLNVGDSYDWDSQAACYAIGVSASVVASTKFI